MALLHGVSARLSLLTVTCPHCGEKQARAKHFDPGHAYRCRTCHRLYDAEGRPAKAARKR